MSARVLTPEVHDALQELAERAGLSEQRPMIGSRPLSYPVVATDQPCTGCGRPILPGSLYKPGRYGRGPRHFGC